MEEILLKVGRSHLKINKSVFLLLLDSSPVKELAAYKKVLEHNEIRFSDLKEIAIKSDVPYPLFLTTPDIVDKHIKDWHSNLIKKLPSKNELQLVGRGGFKIEDIHLIITDLGRKQEFLKKRILDNAEPNPFIGYSARKIRGTHTNKEIANDIRSYLEINLQELRTKSKAGVLDYIRTCAESNNVLVSFSSHNFMPQRIDSKIGMSGICIKDKKFPIIFINTRDGDTKPKILETDGRQVFTLTAMLVCIAVNRFVFSTKTGRRSDPLGKRVLQIVGEVLIPKEDLLETEISNIEELKQEATTFKVTPSMFLMRMLDCRLIDSQLAKRLREKLKDELDSMPPTSKRSPLAINGYAKYNGARFSREIVRAFRTNKISSDEMKNILFRKGRMNQTLLNDYNEKFK